MPSGICYISFCFVFQHNSIVQTLDLADNDMGPKGAEYIADMLKENNFVVNLVSETKAKIC